MSDISFDQPVSGANVQMRFVAKWSNKCADCGHWWQVGEEIEFREFGSKLLYHVVCPEPFPSIELRPNEVVCQTCFIVKPCECE